MPWPRLARNTPTDFVTDYSTAGQTGMKILVREAEPLVPAVTISYEEIERVLSLIDK